MSLTPCEHIPYPILISSFFVQACLTALGLLLTRRLWVQIFVMIIFFYNCTNMFLFINY
jgi:hypothetical protein